MTERELKELESALELMNEGDAGYDDLKKLISNVKLKLKADESGDVEKSKSFDEQINEALSHLEKSDSFASKEIKDILTPVLKLGSDIKDSLTSKEQIQQGEADLGKLSSPEGIRKYESSDLLKRQIRSAQQDLGITNAEANTRGLKQDILDQYVKDINTAKVGSAGQSGAYSSLSQVASNRRLRGAMALQDAKTKMRAATNARLDNLAGAEIRENEASALNDRSRAALDYRKYADASGAAGRAIAAGRLNARTSRLGAIDSISGLINPTSVGFINNKFDDISSSPYGSLSTEDNPPKTELMNFDDDGSIFDLENQYNTSNRYNRNSI